MNPLWLAILLILFVVLWLVTAILLRWARWKANCPRCGRLNTLPPCLNCGEDYFYPAYIGKEKGLLCANCRVGRTSAHCQECNEPIPAAAFKRRMGGF